jgi:hypothetical protein
MVTWHGRLCELGEKFWNNLRQFAFHNRTIFEIFFIMVYAAEQAGLVWLTFRISHPENLALVVSMFAIIVLTTFALHKLIMESRIKVLEQEIAGAIEDKNALELKNRTLKEKYDELVDSYDGIISKDLYNSNISSRRKEGIK